jgi:membrane-bound metal-dependent hydrolase YbcI (DUF457 family)
MSRSYDSSVSVVSITRRVLIHYTVTASIPALRRTQFPVRYKPTVASPEIKLITCTSAHVKKMWMCTYTPPYTFIEQHIIKHQHSLRSVSAMYSLARLCRGSGG